MNLISRDRFTYGMIFLLVLVNLALLATFWYSRTKAPVTEPPKVKTGSGDQGRPQAHLQGDQARARQSKRIAHFLETELEFTKEQVKKFQRLTDEHHQSTSQLRHQMDELRKEMMGHLLDEDLDKTKVEALAQSIGKKMIEMETGMFYHILSLLKLGDSQQEGKYKDRMRKILEQFRPPDHRSGPQGGPQGERSRSDRPPGNRPPGDGPPGDQRKGPQAQELMNRIQDELRLSELLAVKIRVIVEAAFKQLNDIPSQYDQHHERREAAETIFRNMDKQIEALLTGEQIKQYREIDKGGPPGPPRH